jgi:hypothetical protein
MADETTSGVDEQNARREIEARASLGKTPLLVPLVLTVVYDNNTSVSSEVNEGILHREQLILVPDCCSRRRSSTRDVRRGS